MGNEKKMGEVIVYLMRSSDKMGPPSFFAGPKCLQPPNPCSLPKPPMNWILSRKEEVFTISQSWSKNLKKKTREIK